MACVREGVRLKGVAIIREMKKIFLKGQLGI
jgi:hypothetical protein